jgi:hypothetical protein
MAYFGLCRTLGFIQKRVSSRSEIDTDGWRLREEED